MVPDSYDRLARRSFRKGQETRRRIFVALVAAAGASALVALFAGGAMWEVNLAIDASLALYIALLLEAKKRREERGRKVHRMASSSAEVSFEGRAHAYGGERI